MKRVSESTSVHAKKSRMDDGSFHESSPPAYHFALGSQKYAVVCPFQDSFKVHVRQYALDENHLCHPTKVGVVMSPYVWECFADEMEHFDVEKFFACQKELFISSKLHPSPESHNQADQARRLFKLQKIFERGDGILQFASTFMTLTEWEFQALIDVRKQLSKCFREQFFGPTFQKLVLHEKAELGDSVTASTCGPTELLESLVMVFKSELDQNIIEVFECDGCKRNYNDQIGHECITQSPFMRFTSYFDRAIAHMKLKIFARHFVHANAAC